MKKSYWLSISLVVVCTVILCIVCTGDEPEPHVHGTFRADDLAAPTFENCTNTTLEKCNPNATCLHYTCKTANDAARINTDSINLVCGGKDTDIFQCKTVDNTTFCGCGPMLIGANACPDGLVKKFVRGPGGICAPSLENSIFIDRPTICTKDSRSYPACARTT